MYDHKPIVSNSYGASYLTLVEKSLCSYKAYLKFLCTAYSGLDIHQLHYTYGNAIAMRKLLTGL